ncbi:unnamed protein product [Closterium sp. NIES-54]
MLHVTGSKSYAEKSMAALPAKIRVALPCLLCRPAGCRVALPCPSRRLACHRVALPCQSRRPAGRRIAQLPARRIAACASPCPARAEPTCCPHRPAKRRPAARTVLLLPALLSAALLADALLPARRPAGTCTTTRTALPATPCCVPPCWLTPCCPHSPAAHRPAARAALLLRAALLAGALLPACRPGGSCTAARTALPAPPYWPPRCPGLAARHSSLAVRPLSLPCELP